MLVAFGVHGGFGLKIKVNGDLQVDTHHTVEDTGIALGRAFKEALGDMNGIERYGSFQSLWMRLWLIVCLIFQTDLFLFLTQTLSRKNAAIMKTV